MTCDQFNGGRLGVSGSGPSFGRCARCAPRGPVAFGPSHRPLESNYEGSPTELIFEGMKDEQNDLEGSGAHSPDAADELGGRKIVTRQPRTAATAKRSLSSICVVPWSPVRPEDSGARYPKPSDASIADHDGARALSELMGVWANDIHQEAASIDREIMQLIEPLGGSSPRFRRERTRQLRAIVAEIYSLPESGRRPDYFQGTGSSLDLHST